MMDADKQIMQISGLFSGQTVVEMGSDGTLLAFIHKADQRINCGSVVWLRPKTLPNYMTQ